MEVKGKVEQRKMYFRCSYCGGDDDENENKGYGKVGCS